MIDFSPMSKQTNILELECSACAKKYDPSMEQHLCTCGKPLFAKYDLKRAAATLTLENLKSRDAKFVALCGGVARRRASDVRGGYDGASARKEAGSFPRRI